MEKENVLWTPDMTRVIIIYYKQIGKVSEYFFGWASGWIDVSPSKLRGEIQSVCS